MNWAGTLGTTLDDTWVNWDGTLVTTDGTQPGMTDGLYMVDRRPSEDLSKTTAVLETQLATAMVCEQDGGTEFDGQPSEK